MSQSCIEVAIGLLFYQSQVLVGWRNSTQHQGNKYEFPGGKIEAGETPQEALKREIKEELGAEISVGDLLITIEYDYPTFHLSMDCFWCEVLNGDLEFKEHEEAKWLTKEKLNEVEWLPADITLIEEIRKGM